MHLTICPCHHQHKEESGFILGVLPMQLVPEITQILVKLWKILSVLPLIPLFQLIAVC